ncbi:ATP-grasp domain-containing protein [Amycolatopsis sp. EV170708-02-1]|uniref:ATP-grasp domain-containing protein n=1 Tax=Amycolatopsis sp. EV170708-02-1 TaxID=2919322 RepID=UPI001F0C2E9A|nr:ATP-grasp domain-containing protein [Amycolatopsis sp. EV170708-02-1]UMP00009.1 ATP-grasp domain-containing protein [Amycolatopsis sp. EV170708-02-1]
MAAFSASRSSRSALAVDDPAAPTAVIVDGYSTGNFLPRAFAALGVRVVHVQSTPELMSAILAPKLDEYTDNHLCAAPDQLEATCTTLVQLKPIAVLAGQEPGVRLADLLGERLGVASNGAASSDGRRDKFVMIESLRSAGLHCAAQAKAATAADAVVWAQHAPGGFPVVVKPLSSASTDHVVICDGPEEVAAAAEAVLGSTDIFGDTNTEVLVQSYLPGTEYIVDTVSADGCHYTCGVWQYRKRTTPSGNRIYDRDILLDPDEKPVREIVEYVETVLKTLGIRYGPAHAEVIVTPNGPALVEIGARLNGNMHPGFHDRCLGVNQADLTALAYTRPDDFLDRYAGKSYTRVQPAVVHNTFTARHGVVEKVDQRTVDRISALPSVHLVTVKLSAGRVMKPTVDLLTSPLRIFQTAPDPGVIEADYRAIQDLKEQVYQLYPKTSDDRW